MTDAESPACAFTGNAIVPLDQLHPDPDHPRTDTAYLNLADLSESVERLGMLQPILVREDPEGGYCVVAGERRRIVAQRVGLTEVPIAFPTDPDTPGAVFALAQTGTHLPLNPVETALAIQKLVDQGFSQTEIGRKIGKSRSAVSNLLRLLVLEGAVLDYVRSGALSESAARALLIAPHEERLKLAREAVERRLGVRTIEQIARRLAARGAEAWEEREARQEAWSTRDSAAADIASGIGRALGGVKADVRTSTKNAGGELVIRWSDLHELEKIAERIGSLVSRETGPHDPEWDDEDEDDDEPQIEIHLPTEQETEYAIRTGDVSGLLERHALNLLQAPPKGPNREHVLAAARQYLQNQGRDPPL